MQKKGSTPYVEVVADDIRVERWVFTQREFDRLMLGFPVLIKAQDEFIVDVPDIEEPSEIEHAVIAYRNGKISNYYADGTAGVPQDLQDLANDIESYRTDEGEEVSIWADVEVFSATGLFARLIRKPREKVKTINTPVKGIKVIERKKL